MVLHRRQGTWIGVGWICIKDRERGQEEDGFV